MSEQFNPWRKKDIPVELDRKRKGRRDRKQPYTVEDLPVGELFVALHQASGGVLGCFLCEAVDVYESRLADGWRNKNGVYVIARVVDVTLQRDVNLIGRLVHVSVESSGIGWYRGLGVCAWNVAEFNREKEPARRRAEADAQSR